MLSVLCVPFHNPEEMPEDKTHYLRWKDWSRLLSNVIRYAGQKRPSAGATATAGQ
jgi:hypothetical protein